MTESRDIGWRLEKAKLIFTAHVVKGGDEWGKVAEQWSLREWKIR